MHSSLQGMQGEEGIQELLQHQLGTENEVYYPALLQALDESQVTQLL